MTVEPSVPAVAQMSPITDVQELAVSVGLRDKRFQNSPSVILSLSY